MTGVTIANSASCGQEEHQHTEDCLLDDSPVCEKQEHIHITGCYSNPKADIETALDWQRMFADYPYTDILREDLVGIAKTQVGYTESQLNFEVDDSGQRKGYTRYGEWYGAPYNDWSAIFVSFCLNYAGADPEEFPNSSGATAMAELWKSAEKYAPVEQYAPQSGDVVFFDDNTAGIVAEVYSGTFCVIRGDHQDAVTSDMLPLDDTTIIGWGITEEAEAPSQESPEETVPEETAPEEATSEETTPEETVPEETTPEEIVTEKELLDISNGPAFFIFEGTEATTAATQSSSYTLRSSRSATELLPYLEANGGSYFFTLLDQNNMELPKDENGNYIAQANTSYKITISFNSPKGFLPGTYQYQIPNGLMVEGGEGNFILKDNTNVGSWVVTDTGLITLNFNENINSRSDITISATMGITFPEQEDPIDFDGFITVKVEPPADQTDPTVLTKWGEPNAEAGKINWTVRIDGHADSQIPGNIITDQTAVSDWSKPHSYTASDIAGGLYFGVTDANGGWHSWTVSADDPHLIWDETGWSYKIPKTVTCDSCGELELGNEGWVYLVKYTSTPTRINSPGTFDYENKVTVDGQTAWGWSNFTHGESEAIIKKNGSFVSDASGGGFLWEIQVTIPGRPEGQRAEYSWFFMDEMRLLDDEGVHIGHAQNDVHLSQVMATYNGATIQIPCVQEATPEDMFAWDNAWTATEDGISYNRTINLLCRCQCTPETCHWESCGEYWYEYGEDLWDSNGFCQCWTETQDMTFTFVYKTTDLSIVETYGSLGYQLNNHAQLYYMPDSDTSVRTSYDDATVVIPNMFEKQLTHDFDGYTAHYRITINEAKTTLTNGSPLTIHDVMTDTLAYISGSLVITTENVNGHISALQQGVDFTVTYDGTGKQTNDAGKKVHVLDIVILNPQPVMYILDYDTTLIMPEQLTGAIKYSNSADITLWGQSIQNSGVEKVYAEINIAAKSFAVQIAKTCALSNTPLPGATFGLFNAQGGQITTGVTNADGMQTFQTNITEGIVLQEHMLYYLQEIQPPPAYQLDNTQYWFCFCSEATDTCSECSKTLEDTGGVRIPYEEIGTIGIVNYPANVELPATGGIGTPIFILCGLTLVTGPLVYGFSLRRRYGRRPQQ